MAGDVNSPGVLEERPWNVFSTVADAVAGLTFKTPGLLVYITSVGKFYYWKSDIDGFQLLGGAI